MRLPRAFFVYLLFCAIGFLILLTNIKIQSAQYLAWRNFFIHLISPALWSAEEFANDKLNLPSNIVELVNARKENVFLKEKILEYEIALNSYNAILEENEFLKRLQSVYLDSWRNNYKFVVAKLIWRDPSGWSLGCTINVGKRHGIKKNSAVVVPVSLSYRSNSENTDAAGSEIGVTSREGYRAGRFVLVGKITETLEDVSEVMFVTNPMFAVHGLVPETGCDGLVEYFSEDILKFNYPSKVSTPIGADVVVSDSSRVFPPRIYIGRIISNENGVIKVAPAFLKIPLNKVVVLVKK